MNRRRARGSGSVYKIEGRDGWAGAISFGFNANGKRIRRVVYGPSQKAVQQKLADLRARTGADLTAATTMTFGAFARDWFAREVEPNRRATTARFYKLLLDGYIEPQLGRKRLAEITPADVEQVIAVARERRSAAMAAKVRAAIGRIFNRARRLGLVSGNAAAATEAPRVERKTMAFLEPQQVQKLLSAARGERLEALVVLLVTAGLRIGEALALTWADVDLDQGDVRVDKSLQEAGGSLTITRPKTAAGRRTVAIGKRCVDALSERQAAAVREGFHRPGDPVFPTTAGTYQHRKNVSDRLFKPLLVRAELPPIRLHDLRHSSAALSIAAGASARVIAERLGHADAGFTLRTYGHATSALQREDAAAIDRLLTPPKSR